MPTFPGLWGVGMAGSGLCVLGAVAWLWTGGLGGEARVGNHPQGDPSWRNGRPASPAELQVTVSSPAALAGESVSVEIATHDGAPVRAEIFRLGIYGGTGAAKVWSGGPYAVPTSTRCSRTPCPGRQSFSFEVARAWAPGLYVVKVTRADGLRSFTSIVVKAPEAEEPRT
jgi:hypothetical protein